MVVILIWVEVKWILAILSLQKQFFSYPHGLEFYAKQEKRLGIICKCHSQLSLPVELSKH